ncbi:uncharacterized protein EI90DRAFT_3011169 [Cantharellus anzutake]|uniref:uncharacterized protein n=1 Tax=Cantharellus anzutake TaxID=1750568 RepID=UPI0019057974|nr:uncharacterized protein EI90DRAFT_3011169 [Cantharellus anzutake]KAF8342658.1 hypothetical protein EI90DRAFT_3011169 [Cantharellus anzutake]
MWNEVVPAIPLNLITANVLLFISVFTLTYKDAVWAKLARMFAAPFIVVFSLRLVSGDSAKPENAINFLVPAVSIGYAYDMIMHAIDLSIGSLYDTSPPHWVSHRSGKTLPLPHSIRGRLLYALDQLIAVRGASLLADRHWDFSPSQIVEYRSPYPSKFSFMKSAIMQIFQYYLLLDIVDTLVKRYSVCNPASLHPIFELPIITQCLFGVVIASCAVGSVSIMYYALAVVLVGTGLSSDLDLWAPFSTDHSLVLLYHISGVVDGIFYIEDVLFDSPETASSKKYKSDIPPSHQFISVAVAFLASAWIHTLIADKTSGGRQNHEYPTIFHKRPEFFFFAIQPLGIAVDRSIAHLGGSGTKVRFARRLWAWVFLLWTSRWMADGTLRGQELGLLPISPVRGVLSGDWTGKESVKVALARMNAVS